MIFLSSKEEETINCMIGSISIVDGNNLQRLFDNYHNAILDKNIKQAFQYAKECRQFAKEVKERYKGYDDRF